MATGMKPPDNVNGSPVCEGGGDVADPAAGIPAAIHDSENNSFRFWACPKRVSDSASMHPRGMLVRNPWTSIAYCCIIGSADSAFLRHPYLQKSPPDLCKKSKFGTPV